MSKSFGVSFFQSNVGTFRQVSTSFGLSKRRISVVFSCFDQSLILLAASIQRSQTLLLLFTDSLTHSCLVNLIDVTRACEDGNSKLVKVVTVVEVDDEKRIDNSLVQFGR